MGGSVKGGVIHGNYPADITEDGPDSLGRGRLIPTLSFESMLNPIWQWIGIETDEELKLLYAQSNSYGYQDVPAK